MCEWVWVCVHVWVCVCMCVCSCEFVRVCVVLSHVWLCDAINCHPPGPSVHGDDPDKNTGVGYHCPLQGIFPTQGSNPGVPGLLHRWQILYHWAVGDFLNHTRSCTSSFTEDRSHGLCSYPEKEGRDTWKLLEVVETPLTWTVVTVPLVSAHVQTHRTAYVEQGQLSEGRQCFSKAGFLKSDLNDTSRHIR